MTKALPTLIGHPTGMYALLFGYEPIPESVSVAGGQEDVFLLEPVTGAAVVYENGWILVDTGFNPEIARDVGLRSTHYVWDNYAPIIPAGDPLPDQIQAAGLRWDDLAFTVISHLHCDHGGGLRLLEDGPPVVLQAAEHDFAMSDAGLEHYYFRTDYVRPGLTFELVDGDRELADGLHLLDTKGHTPGHQSVQVELPSKTVVLACDAADLLENVTRPVRCGTTTHDELVPSAEKAAERLHSLHNRTGTEVWPGHDPVFWKGIDRPPSRHR